MLFSTIGYLQKSDAEISSIVAEFGGGFSSEISDEISFIFSNEMELEEMGTEMENAKQFKISIVDENIFESMKFRDGRVHSALRENVIREWKRSVCV